MSVSYALCMSRTVMVRDEASRWMTAILIAAVSWPAEGWAQEGQGSGFESCPDPNRPRIALVVSGGLSLGAYQAGFLHYFTEYLKRFRSSDGLRPRIVVATGASAGSVKRVPVCVRTVPRPRWRDPHRRFIAVPDVAGARRRQALPEEWPVDKPLGDLRSRTSDVGREPGRADDAIVHDVGVADAMFQRPRVRDHPPAQPGSADLQGRAEP